MCLPSDALLQHLPSYLGFSYLGCGVSLHGYSSKAQLLLLTLDEGIHEHWKNHSLDKWTFVGKVMSLLFNMLSRLVTTFLPRSKRLLISWLQSPSAVILEHPK